MTQTPKTAGLPCPECKTIIPISLDSLLAERNFRCPNSDCRLVVSLDRSQSRDALDAAMKLKAGLDAAKRKQPGG